MVSGQGVLLEFTLVFIFLMGVRSRSTCRFGEELPGLATLDSGTQPQRTVSCRIWKE